MRYGSVCSGIEAATCAWHPLGWEPQFVSEIDTTASRFLAAKYPTVPNFGDMTNFREWPDATIDVLVGGTPCQSFSVAGLRKGMDDPRGNLVLTYLAIVDRYRPKWCVWENVPGVLSSNSGKDFGSFLGGLAELGYGFAYKVLDAQYVRVESHTRAVPQRRRRVFVVGYLGDWRPAAAVLFERESLSGNPAPRREAGKGFARGVKISPVGSSEWPAAVAPTFGTGWGDRHPGSSNQDWVAQKGGHFVPDVSPAMKARDAKGPSSDGDGDGDGLPIIAQTLLAKSNDSHAADLDNYIAFPGRMSGTQVAAEENLSPSIGAINPMAVAHRQSVRRLTPLECTRLQGFPDLYFDSARLNKPLSDGAKYKLLGNSMAVNVMRFIGDRISMVDAPLLNSTQKEPA